MRAASKEEADHWQEAGAPTVRPGSYIVVIQGASKGLQPRLVLDRARIQVALH